MSNAIDILFFSISGTNLPYSRNLAKRNSVYSQKYIVYLIAFFSLILVKKLTYQIEK